MSDIKQLFSLGDSAKDQEVAEQCELGGQLEHEYSRAHVLSFSLVLSLCTIYSITPEALKNKWQAFAISTGCGMKPSAAYVQHLKKSLQRDFDRQIKKQKTSRTAVVTKKPRMDLSEYGIDMDNQDDSVESL